MKPLLFIACAALALATPARAITASPEELALSRQWLDANFGSGVPAAQPSLKVLHEDTHDAVVRGKSWRGTPFQLGEKTYAHGLAFNSTKHLLVQLGQPAERFTADVGLENNDDTRRGAAMGNGSVTFHRPRRREGGRSPRR